MSALITGRKPVLEALKAGTDIEKIVVLKGARGPVIEEIRDRAMARNISVKDADQQEFRTIAGEGTVQGIVAVVTRDRFVSLPRLLTIPKERNEQGFLLILDGIEDPQNLGALIRTAECAGAHGVAIPRHHAATVTGTVVKASAGATEHVAIVQVTNVVHIIEELKRAGYWIVGLDAASTTGYTSVDYSTPVAIVVGSEGKGIRRLVKEHCDHLVRIPLRGKIGSLNASVAGALVMYEIVRQRHHP